MTTLKKIDIYKGDSSDFKYNISVNLNSQIDFTGWTAIIQLGRINKKYLDISSKKINIIFNSEETKLLNENELNICNLKLITPDGKAGTQKPLFMVNVLKEVVFNE